MRKGCAPKMTDLQREPGATAHDASESIPVIDIAANTVGGPPASVVRAFDEACETVGFIVITGHGVEDGVIQSMMHETRAFFSLDAASKDAYRCPAKQRDEHPANKFRGYNGGYSYLDGPPDHIEGFQVAWFEDREAMLHAGYSPEFADGFVPNIWPSAPPGFKTAWRAYFEQVKKLGDYLLQIASLALELPIDWFAPKFARQSSYMVANYYPPQEGPPEDGGQRLHPHTDYGAFTVLHQDVAIGGLEVSFRDGSWQRVPYIPGTFVVNLGDLLAKWTNDKWVATPHRVRNPEPGEYGQDRISVPYFQHPNLDAMIETIPTCIAPGDAPHHPPVLWRDWGALRINQLTLRP